MVFTEDQLKEYYEDHINELKHAIENGLTIQRRELGCMRLTEDWKDVYVSKNPLARVGNKQNILRWIENNPSNYRIKK
jgi:hypothetical protein